MGGGKQGDRREGELWKGRWEEMEAEGKETGQGEGEEIEKSTNW